MSSGQVFEPEQAVPVARPPSTRIMLHNLVPESKILYQCIQFIKTCSDTKFGSAVEKTHSCLLYVDCWHWENSCALRYVPQSANATLKIFLLTSISQRALLLVAEVADCRPVVRRKTYCFLLWSSHVRNFSCSAWNSRTTSPWREEEHLLLSNVMFWKWFGLLHLQFVRHFGDALWLHLL